MTGIHSTYTFYRSTLNMLISLLLKHTLCQEWVDSKDYKTHYQKQLYEKIHLLCYPSPLASSSSISFFNRLSNNSFKLPSNSSMYLFSSVIIYRQWICIFRVSVVRLVPRYAWFLSNSFTFHAHNKPFKVHYMTSCGMTWLYIYTECVYSVMYMHLGPLCTSHTFTKSNFSTLCIHN